MSSWAVGLATADTTVPDSGPVITYKKIQTTLSNNDTKCATGVFADALASTAHNVKESDDELTIQQWITVTFADKTVLQRVLECPEIKNINDEDTIKFLPIIYTFPGGRNIVVNYETQPLVLKQRLQMSSKRTLPQSDPNPRIGPGEDVWTNTDPAWYGIIITEHGSLDKFVGPQKNNTVSMKYIHDNIDELYPHGMNCTNKSALAADNNSINRAVSKTVGDDSNDYYVAGDIDLGWIMWAEVALDVVISIATFGGYTAIAGATKATRASKAFKNMSKTMKGLRNIESNADWIKATKRAAELTEQINKLDKIADATKIANLTSDLDKINDTIKTLENGTQAVRQWATTTHKIEQITSEISKLDKVADQAKITDLTKELDKLKDTAKQLEKLDNVKEYQKYAETFKKLSAYRNSLRLLRNAKRGNVAVRLARATKSAFSGNKLIHHASKLGRSSSIAGRVRDWLYMSTMRNIGVVAKAGASTGILYTALKIAGDFYDRTETSTGDYTSGVEFSPLLLLSADDIPEQGNVINYGMWLMWAGDSVSAADDDAAYLQAMDFAAKFHEDLTEHQNETNTPCNVDIFVVRPILRNPGTPEAELYYLIMNDTPWTTAK